MSISAGGDVAIVLVILLIIAIVAGGLFVWRRRYRRWKVKQHSQITSREFDLDFDTNDLEIGATKPNHTRKLSDSSDAPLIKDSKSSLRSPSAISFESGIYPVSTHAYMAKPRSESPDLLPNPFEVPTKPAIPIIKEPSPPPKPVAPSSLTTAEHQLTALVSRPSFLAKPRSAPRPSMRRAGSRGAHDLRATMLTRLASSRSARRSRSVDAMDEADSPSSIYSQASAAPGYRSAVDFSTAFVSGPTPPVPPLPTQYQQPSLAAGWRAPALPTIMTTPPGAPSSPAKSSPSPLEDSHAFPLPVAEDFPVDTPKTPSAQWFSTLWASPSSTSPSPSHSSPNEPVVIHSSVSERPSVRSLEVSRSVPQYSIGSQEEAQQGMVGYQLPPNWRSRQAVVAMPTPQVYGGEDTTPRASTAAIVYHG